MLGAQVLLNKLLKLDINIRYYELEVFSNLRTVLVRLDGHSCPKPFGSYIGLSCHNKFEHAVVHATFEATRKIANRVINDNDDELTLADFRGLKSRDISDHGRLARNLEYSQLLNYSSQQTPIISIIPKVDVKTFVYTHLNSMDPILSECPLVVVAAENRYLTQLIIGDYNLNTLRCNTYGTKLSTLPHAMS